MAVRFILGRAGAGKTRRCVDEVLSAMHAAPHSDPSGLHPSGAEVGAPVLGLILLVPEQASFQTERTLAVRSARQGFMTAAVLSFSQLARRVFAHEGGAPDLLTPTSRRLALHAVIQAQRSELAALRTAAEFPGFTTQLSRQIETWLAEGLRPEDLTAAAERSADRLESTTQAKVRELAALYRGYLEWLGPQRADPQQHLARLRDRLTLCPWLKDVRVWVDGFSGFTGEELATLEALARQARELTIALLLDPQQPGSDPLGLFRRTEQTYERLRRGFATAGVPVAEVIELRADFAPRYRGVSALAQLERALCGARGPAEVSVSATCAADQQPDASEHHEPPAVRVLECPTHRDELTAAARFIRRRVQESHGALRYRDFAVITRDLAPLAELVAEVFADFEIPFFLDRRRPLRGHPLGRLLRSALAAVMGNLPLEALLELIQTGLTPLSRTDGERLEAQARQEEAHGWSFWSLARWPGEPAERGAARRALVAGLSSLAASEAAESGVSAGAGAAPVVMTGRTWAERLYGLLERCGVRQRLGEWIAAARRAGQPERAETHRLAWEGHLELLTELHALLADTPLSAADVAALLDGALAERTLALAPPALDQVLVSAIDRSRHPDIKYAWVFAFNEGLFPQPPAEDTLLSTAERRGLGLDALQPRRDDLTAEALLAYIACTRASNGLTLSYAARDSAGDELPPSPLLTDVLAALPGLMVEHMPEDEPPVCLSEAAWRRVSRPDARARRLCEFLEADPAVRPALDRMLGGLRYENSPAPLGNYRRPAASGARSLETGPSAGQDPSSTAAADSADALVWVGSPGEANTALQCPFQHFARYGLRLEEAAGTERLQRELGEAAHELLAALTQRLMARGDAPRAWTDEIWQGCFDQVVGEFWQALPTDIRTRRPRYAFMLERQIELVRDVAAVHVARWQRGSFRPWAVELGFGLEPESGGNPAAEQAARPGLPGLPSLPGLSIALSGGRRAAVRGKLDRIDRARVGNADYLLIYDYKPSGESPRPARLTGYGLQMMSYLAAVAAAHDRTQAVAAGVLQAPLTPHRAVPGPKYFTAAAPGEQQMYLYQPRGLIQTEVWRALDAEYSSGRSPVAFIQLKKDGAPYAACDLVPARRLGEYVELAHETLRLAIEQIVQGRIDVAPLIVSGRQRACRYCPYASVCRVDRAFNPGRRAEDVLPVLNDSDERTTTRD